MARGRKKTADLKVDLSGIDLGLVEHRALEKRGKKGNGNGNGATLGSEKERFSAADELRKKILSRATTSMPPLPPLPQAHLHRRGQAPRHGNVRCSFEIFLARFF